MLLRRTRAGRAAGLGAHVICRYANAVSRKELPHALVVTILRRHDEWRTAELRSGERQSGGGVGEVRDLETNRKPAEGTVQGGSKMRYGLVQRYKEVMRMGGGRGRSPRP